MELRTARKQALGRGLDALIPAGPEIRPGVLELPIDAIGPNPRQPRSQFPESELADLTDSIRQHGILQPLLVIASDDGYQLIAGERRLMAAKNAGLMLVPAVVREAGAQASLEMALVENLQRSDLNALEAAEGYRQLVEDFDLTHEEVAARLGKSRSGVTNSLRLLKLSAAVRKALETGKISEGHARALLALPLAQQQASALKLILSRDLNVRQTEELVRQLGETRAPRKRVKLKDDDPQMADLAKRLEGALGTKVDLRRSKQGGQVIIHYYSDEE
ncbi:MAG: ParB/RepB/Spo0J family partition protein, partial [Anaerolineales bacterium]